MPVICVSGLVCTFHSLMISQWLSEWWRDRGELVLDADWLITFSGSTAFQIAFMLVRLLIANRMLILDVNQR